MTKIMYSAVRSDGTEETALIDAADLNEADALLRERGRTAIRFHFDPAWGDVPDLDTARDQIGADSQHQTVFASLAVAALIGICAGALVMPTDSSLAARALLSALIAVPIFAVTGLPVVLYRSVREAMNWRRYPRALGLIRTLRLLVSLGPGRFAIGNLLVYEHARILAGLQRLPEALALLAALDGSDERVRSEIRRAMPTIFDHARDYEQMRSALVEAAGHEPSDAALWLDLALVEALRFENLRGARHALDRAWENAMTVPAEGVAQLVESMIALESSPPTALTAVDSAARVFHRSIPGVAGAGFQALARWHRARVLARLGFAQGAESELDAAIPLMLANGDHELVERARVEIRRLERSARD